MCTSHPAPTVAPMPTGDANLADRIFQATIGTLEIFSIFLGRQLGLYEALRDGRARDAEALAREAGVSPRYAREWLEQQAVADVLCVTDPAASAASRTYSLPERHARVLCDAEDGEHVAPFADMLAGIAGALPEVLEAYRSGHGVPYERYGPFFRDGQGAINRPAFVHELTGVWLPAMPDLHARLAREDGVRIADVGCGIGHSTIALAESYPRAEVIGYDTDRASIEDARRHAVRTGSRARFECGDFAGRAGRRSVDLVLILETLHDVAHPALLLSDARAALAPGGSVLIADERVADRFVAPGDDVERMMYGWSVTHCLPSSMATPGSAALGTVLRSDAVRTLARDAGFSRFEVLPIENELFRFYRLRP